MSRTSSRVVGGAPSLHRSSRFGSCAMNGESTCFESFDVGETKRSGAAGRRESRTRVPEPTAPELTRGPHLGHSGEAGHDESAVKKSSDIDEREQRREPNGAVLTCAAARQGTDSVEYV